MARAVQFASRLWRQKNVHDSRRHASKTVDPFTSKVHVMHLLLYLAHAEAQRTYCLLEFNIPSCRAQGSPVVLPICGSQMDGIKRAFMPRQIATQWLAKRLSHSVKRSAYREDTRCGSKAGARVFTGNFRIKRRDIVPLQ
jgi:hypothetical protein